jgi:CBS domain-containing membrane protein
LDQTLHWLRAFVPQRNTVPRHERMRSVAGALIGLLLTAGLSMHLLGTATLPLAPQVAPMGASAVLLFCVPASPLAQPWSVIGGNTISALVGIACAKAIGNPLLAAPLAGSLAILVMFLLRCLHPPSGAVALTTVLGGPAVHAAGFGFAFVPVCLNSTLIVLVALHLQQPDRPALSAHPAIDAEERARDARPGADRAPRLHQGRPGRRAGALRPGAGHQPRRPGRDPARDRSPGLRAPLRRHHLRRDHVEGCGDGAAGDAAGRGLDACCAATACTRCRCWTRPATWSAWSARTISCTMLGLDDYQTLGERLRGLFGHLFGMRGDRPGKVVEIMQRHVKTVGADDPIAELVPLMSNRGLHHIPVVDERGIFAGVVSHSDLLAALFEGRLMEPEFA